MISQESKSIWQKAELPYLPHLGSNTAADVCVIGAGIAGLTTAYHLLEAGKSVVVLERESLHGGQTILTSAHLSAALDDRYFRLARLHGEDGAGLAAESHGWAVGEVERIVTKESIDCDFLRVNGYLFLGAGDSEDLLEKEQKACHEAGLSGVRLLRSHESPLFSVGAALKFPGQARFHPGKYLAGLASAIERKGGRIFVHTEATEIEGVNTLEVNTNRAFHVICDTLVVATNVPFVDRVTLQTKMAPYRSYVVGIALADTQLDLSLFWDTSDPYHYVRSCSDTDGEQILLVGGEDHRTGQDQPEDAHQNLVEWAKNRMGVDGEVRYHWSGQILEPHDGLAFIGKNPGDRENMLVVTGTSGSGLTYGTMAGKILTDTILGRDNPWAKLYSPSRVSLRSLGTFVKENLRGSSSYSDWISGGDVASPEEIPPGEGAILRDGLQKIAAYKNPSGHLRFFSAVCPHLSGLVRWNSQEKTWDCPCHGSRFSRDGQVINGPAVNGLREIGDIKLQEPA
jgi:glycine/D-amino acid oxidase-like deaminating enzyme/nitrite reductase/ring-hydroxylating ferredoxin subunit